MICRAMGCTAWGSERFGKCSQNSPKIPSSMAIHQIFGEWMIVKIHEDSEEPWTTGLEDWSVTIDSIHAIVDLNGLWPNVFCQTCSVLVDFKDLMGPVKRLMKCLIHWSLRISGTIWKSDGHLKPFEEIWKFLFRINWRKPQSAVLSFLFFLQDISSSPYGFHWYLSACKL